MMTFKVGERVLVRPDLIEWKIYGGSCFVSLMSKFKGKIFRIKRIVTGFPEGPKYQLWEDKECWFFTNEMLKRLNRKKLNSFINLKNYV